MTNSVRYSIERIAPGAASYFRRLPQESQQRIKRAYQHLCNVSPFLHTNRTVITPLKGKRKGLWRYRSGDVRIIAAPSPPPPHSLFPWAAGTGAEV